MRSLHWAVTVALAIAGAAPGAAFACNISIRDAGIVRDEAGPFYVYVLVKDATTGREALAEAVKEAENKTFAGANVVAELVNVDRDRNHDAVAHLGALKLADLPAAIVVSPRGKARALPGLTPGKVTAAGLKAALERAATSPAREGLRKLLAERWCVAVLACGAKEPENEKARKAISKAIEKVTGTVLGPGREIKPGPALLEVKSGDAAEDLLLWSLGIPEDAASRPAAAVVYGLGKRCGLVIEGQALVEDTFEELFLILGENCTCTMDREILDGAPVPLRWDDDARRRIIERAEAATAAMREGDEDPDRPAEDAKPNEEKTAAEKTGRPAKLPLGIPAEAKTEAIAAGPVASEPDLNLGARTMTALLPAVGALVLLVLVGAAVLARRRTRGD